MVQSFMVETKRATRIIQHWNKDESPIGNFPFAVKLLIMISLETSLKHLAWSNQKFFSLFTEFPDEVFGLKAAEDEWPVGQILTHFAGSGEWYQYCLNGGRWTDLKRITEGAIVIEYLPIMAKLDAVLFENLSLSDNNLEIESE